MFNVIISIVLIVGGLKLLFEVRKRYNLYFATGFIIYGIHYLLLDYIVYEGLWDVIFSIPRLLAAFCLMMSAVFFLKGEKHD